jgi:two-component system response regulator RegX3
MARTILVVEDETTLRETLIDALETEGFRVIGAADGRAALARFRADQPDLVLLDLMLPELSGIEVCRIIRAESGVPIVMLTAKDSELDKVVGLELGADDYVTKPFSMAELMSRVRAILRRCELEASRRDPVRVVGGLKIDLGRHQVSVDGHSVYLTSSQFKLLALLAENPGDVVTRHEIMHRLWESDFVGDEHVCDVHISNLRHKIEREPSHPQRVVTIRGVGYKLVSA